MFQSAVIDVAIGLIFCYAAVALLASAANEMLASVFKLRARTLLAGIKQLLNDPKLDALAHKIYQHGLVNSLSDGKTVRTVSAAGLPSYIRAGNFASALIDTLQAVPGKVEGVKTTIDAIEDPQLRTILQGMYLRAAGDLNHFHQQISDWFDDAMARLSGAYKRRSQLVSFAVALAVCILFNIDSVHLFRTLWEHPTLVAALASTPADQDPSTMLTGMLTLPIGQDYPPLSDLGAWARNGIGLLVTASAAMFGAPFWFDLLQRIVQIRSTGPTPAAMALNPAASEPLTYYTQTHFSAALPATEGEAAPETGGAQ